MLNKKRTIFGIIALLVLFVTAAILTFNLFRQEALLEFFGDISFKNLYASLSREEIIFGGNEMIDGVSLLSRSNLDGVPRFGENELVFAVMIDNHPDARHQQIGLSQASVVYETLAEGGVTRYMVLFSHQDIEKVGPVRSARPYYVDWASEYKAVYLHAGASNDAFREIIQSDILDVDGLYYEEVSSDYFRRDLDYYAPHNLFGYLSAIRGLVDSRGWKGRLKERRFKFGEEEYFFDSASNIKINFSYPNFLVEYLYDMEKGGYVRYLASKSHFDQGEEILPKNILIQFTDYYPVDDEGRLEMRTYGEGKALYFAGGKVGKGRWIKKMDDFTRFFNEFDKELVLKEGQTWIEVVHDEWRVEYD